MSATNGNAMERLLVNSSIIKLYISLPSGKKRLRWDKLGVPAEISNSDLVTAGAMFVLPKDTLSGFYKLRNKANSLIDKASVEFSIGRLVPDSKLVGLREDLGKINIEFDQLVIGIKGKYETLKQKLLAKWRHEAVLVAAKHNDEDLVFRVMRNVEAEFPTWENLAVKFSFGWSEYTDLSSMASEFIRDATAGILGKMSEFATHLQEKLGAENLSDRNMKPIRKWIEGVRESIEVFESDKLNNLLTGLEAWTEEGLADELSVSASMSRAMSDTLSGIVEAADDQVNEIAADAVARLTSQSRSIER